MFKFLSFAAAALFSISAFAQSSDPNLTSNPEPGTYTLELPAYSWGLVAQDGYDYYDGPAATLTYFIGGGSSDASVKYDLDIISTKPAEGKVDMSNYTWEVTTFDINADYDLAPESDKQASLVCESAGYNKSGTISNVSASAFVRTLKFTNGNEPTKTGTYVLTIPEGTFGDADWRQDPKTGHANREIKVYFMVSANGNITTAYDIDITSVTPANDATVSIANDTPVSISFTAPGELGFFPQQKIGVACPGAEYNGFAIINSAETADDVTTFNLSLDTPITVNGEYTLTFPEGLIGDADYIANWANGHSNKAFTTSFIVEGGADQPETTKYDLAYTVTPENGSQLPIKEKVFISFEFPEGTVPTEDSPRASLQSSQANYFLTVLFQKGEKNGTFTLNYATAPKREGTYTISIPEGLFFNEALNSYSPAIELAYIIQDTAIDEIPTDDLNSSIRDNCARHGIYDLNGKFLGNDLNALPAGIYITQNQKFIIAK